MLSAWRKYLVWGLCAFTLIVVPVATTLLVREDHVRYAVSTMWEELEDWGKWGTDTNDLARYPTDYTRGIVPIKCHSHNDYWRRIPFWDAIRAGCVSVEPDVWLFNDDLLVGHHVASLQVNRTFERLYVKPLLGLLERMNPDTPYSNGTKLGIFDEDPAQTLVLMVDIKTEGVATYNALLRQIEPLREGGWLTYFKDGVMHNGPVTVVGSGNTPFTSVTADQNYRHVFFDAPLSLMTPSNAMKRDLADAGATSGGGDGAQLQQGMHGVTQDAQFTSSNSYYASGPFHRLIGEVRGGKLSDDQLKLLRSQIRGAHERGIKVRYWAIPSWPISLRNYIWATLMQEGADMLSVDDLEAASKGVW